jgi:hypothetical protein
MKSVPSWLAITGVFGLACGLGLSGCGTPAAPQPPSLKLPAPVADLTAARNGSSVTLHWTNPRKTTDHLLMKGPIPAQVCRRHGSGNCEIAGQIAVAPGEEGEFHETLPASLLDGKPRRLSYFVELKNRRGKSAGLSNPAEILAGAAPPAIIDLSAEVRADGVALRWKAGSTTPVRLHRHLLEDAAKFPGKPEKQGNALKGNAPKNDVLTSAPREPQVRDLLVDPPAAEQRPEGLSGTLDNTARFGESYEYTLQRVERLTVDGKTLELAGELSAPLRVDVIDRFPPAVPQGLAAVAVTEEKTIDLSWQPGADADLAGYIVYRVGSGKAANGNGIADWMRISGPQPIPTSAYRDRAVEPGHTYRYRVSAIDLTGHESEPSAEAQESVLNP